MDYINYALNDKSKNDRLLIKELSIYIRNHYSKGLPINKKFVSDVIDIILRNSEIDFNYIYYSDYSEIAVWYSYDETIEFNITEMVNALRKVGYYNSRVANKKLLSYFYVLSTIIHELTHGRQDYVMKNDNNIIYRSCDALVNENYETYSEHHDDILIERYANLRGDSIAYEVLSYVFSDKETRAFITAINSYLLDGYKIDDDGNMISALDTYNKIMEDCGMPIVDIDVDEDIDLYSRLYLGLPITKDEYKKIRKLYSDIYYERVKKRDIRKLINKL